MTETRIAMGGATIPLAGMVYRSEGYAMFTEYVSDERGDPTIELWRFAGEDDPTEGFGYLEITVHEIVQTQASGTLAVYHRQWFAPDGEPAWGSRRKRCIGAIGSLKALIRRRKMTISKPAQQEGEGTAHEKG